MKKTIRLTENDLHKIVKEAVNRVLNENQAPIYRQQLQNGKFMIINANTGQPVCNTQFDQAGIFMNDSLTAMCNGHTYEVYPNGQVQQTRV